MLDPASPAERLAASAPGLLPLYAACTRLAAATGDATAALAAWLADSEGARLSLRPGVLAEREWIRRLAMLGTEAQPL